MVRPLLLRQAIVALFLLAPLPSLAWESKDPDMLEKVRQFRSPSFDWREILENFKSKLAESRANHEGFAQTTYTHQQVENLPQGTLSRFEIHHAQDGSFELIHQVSPEALQNPMVLWEDILALTRVGLDYAQNSLMGFPRALFNGGQQPSQQLTNAYSNLAQTLGGWGGASNSGGKGVRSPAGLIELQSLTEHGSKRAQAALARLKKETASALSALVSGLKDSGNTFINSSLFPSAALPPDAQGYLDLRIHEAEEQVKIAEREAKAELRRAETDMTQQQAKWAELESQQDKLDDLVKRGDRRGVAQLLKAYLPWPLMEAPEKKFWKRILKQIESPTQSNRRIVFRGMNGDTRLSSNPDERFVFAPVIDRNMGSYTRRLRSLTTMRALWSDNQKPDGAFIAADTALGHASADLQKSMFFSVTDSLEVALGYAQEWAGSGQNRNVKIRLAAFSISDDRLLNSPYAAEANIREKMVPLLVFPDEILGYAEAAIAPGGDTQPAIDQVRTELFRQIEAKLGHRIDEAQLIAGQSKAEHMAEALRKLTEWTGAGSRCDQLLLP